MEGSRKERMKVGQRQKLSKNIPFFPVLSELRSVPCRSAAVKLPTAKLSISPSNGLLNNPRRWRCPEACEKQEVSRTEILLKEKDVDVCPGVSFDERPSLSLLFGYPPFLSQEAEEATVTTTAMMRI